MSEDEIIEHIEYSLLNPCFNNGNSTIINNEDLKGLLDLYQQEKEKNKELELEKEINQEAINIANNQLCNYELGYQAGLHKEITATEVVIRNRENLNYNKNTKILKMIFNGKHIKNY